MRILADENIPLLTIETLRSWGHDVLSLHEPGYKGIKDLPLWDLAQKEGRVILTTDRGFSKRREEKHYGILIVRLRRPNLDKIHKRVLSAISDFDEKEWPGLLVTMRDTTRVAWRSKWG